MNDDAVDTIPITITAPGLLTLETTGSVDTIGMLDNTDGTVEFAHAESGGSGDNFKLAVPVDDGSYSVKVEEGQTSGGEYLLDMGFKVAMASPSVTGVAGVAAADIDWGNTPFTDDTMLEIRRIAADGNRPDEDYFLFTPDESGFLTVNANDDDTVAKDSDTRGTLFGAMETGPLMEMRVGQIAMDFR